MSTHQRTTTSSHHEPSLEITPMPPASHITEVDLANTQLSPYGEKVEDKGSSADVNVSTEAGTENKGYSYDLANDPHRGLRMRHVQLIAISGAIGAALFVSIGGPLTKAGPLGLIFGIAIWSFVVWTGSNCLIEMTTLLPLDGGFITFAERFVDPGFAMALGWNFIVAQLALICFELTAINVIVEYWTQSLHPAILISVGIVALGVIQLYSVRWFGEVEFWISITKVLLMIGLTCYTFITMVGGNPLGDRYGFRFWQNPGPFAGFTGAKVVRGIFDTIIWSCFAVVGPDYISIIGGEVKNPRRILPKAFNSIVYRIIFFYITGALCIGIVAAADDPALLGAIAAGAPGAAKSPYVISMNRLNIPVLPSLVNALILVSIFSTANSFVFSASRAMLGLAQKGQAPKILGRLNRQGVPWVAVMTCLAFGALAFLSVSSGTVKVLDWWISLVGSAQLLNWFGIAITWFRFRSGLKSQNLINTDFLPVRGRFQPISGWWLLIWSPIIFLFNGYAVFMPGAWDTPTFIFAYGSGFIFLALYFGSKIWSFTKTRGIRIIVPAENMDFVSDLKEIEDMTAASEAQRASHARGAGQRISDFFF